MFQFRKDQRSKFIEGLLVSLIPGLEQSGQFVSRPCGHRGAECNESEETTSVDAAKNFSHDDSCAAFIPPVQDVRSPIFERMSFRVLKRREQMRQQLKVYLL